MSHKIKKARRKIQRGCASERDVHLLIQAQLRNKRKISKPTKPR